jgi:hypothetical protein
MWCYVSVVIAPYRSITILGDYNAAHFCCVIYLGLGFQMLFSNKTFSNKNIWKLLCIYETNASHKLRSA